MHSPTDRPHTDRPDIDTAVHLAPEARPFLLLSDEERIQQVRVPQFIRHKQADTLLNDLEMLLNHPKIERMPARVLIAQPFNGKSSLLTTFLELHPPGSLPDDSADLIPVLLVDAPTKTTDSLYARILERVNAQYRPQDGDRVLKVQTRRLMRRLGVRVLMIDEGHNPLHGSHEPQQQFLTELKDLSNDLDIPIIVAGTDRLLNALRRDAQLASRFEPRVLSPWKSDKEFLRLLAGFEQTLPLWNASNLKNPKTGLPDRLYDFSEGIIGNLARVLQAAVVWAIKNGTECIDSAALDGIEWVLPSKAYALARRKYLGLSDDDDSRDEFENGPPK
jgi:Bacterial TniB protein